MKRIKRFVVQLMARTPYNVRRRLPLITLDPLDLLLASCWARERSLNIVQVGACDGSASDPIHQYVKAGTARAILIEPNPFAFERLQRAYADVPGVTLIPAAIGDRDGEITFYRAKESGTAGSEIDWSLQFASLSRAHVRLNGVKDEQIEAITVPCLTLPSVVRQQGVERIDLLQIDAEGLDANIVRVALQLPVLPGCINFEHAHLPLRERNPLYDSLKAHGYLLGYDSWNILAVQTSLLERMRSGPASEAASAVLVDRRIS